MKMRRVVVVVCSDDGCGDDDDHGDCRVVAVLVPLLLPLSGPLQ